MNQNFCGREMHSYGVKALQGNPRYIQSWERLFHWLYIKNARDTLAKTKAGEYWVDIQCLQNKQTNKTNKKQPFQLHPTLKTSKENTITLFIIKLSLNMKIYVIPLIFRFWILILILNFFNKFFTKWYKR